MVQKEKKKSQSINNDGRWTIKHQDAHQLCTSHFGRNAHSICAKAGRSFSAEYPMKPSQLHHISAPSAQAKQE